MLDVLLCLDCEWGRYGADCAEVCNCAHQESCDAVTGACHCIAGYQGPTCSQGNQ